MMKRWFRAIDALLCAFTPWHALIVFAGMMAASAQTKTPLVQPRWTFFDQSGAACAGCQLSSFLAGTTTPTPTYTDASGTSQNTNPIILGTDGGAFIWVGTPTLKLVLKDALGNLIWTADNIPGNGSGAGGCGFAGAITFENSTISGLDCDQYITINKTLHTINVGGPLPATHFQMTNLSAITAGWTWDITSKETAAKSIGGGTAGAGKYIDGGTGDWTTLPTTSGTVTSVDATVPAQMTIAGNPITSSGTLAFGLNVTGTGTKVATATAAGVDGNCAQWATGNVGDAGNPCAVKYPFTGTSGYQKLSSGLILEWGHASLIADGSPGTNVCFPFAFPNSVLNVTATDDLGSGASRILSVRTLTPSIGATPYPCANGGFWAWSDGSGNGAWWFAIGY